MSENKSDLTKELHQVSSEIQKMSTNVDDFKSEQREKFEKMLPRFTELEENLQKSVAAQTAKEEQIKKLEDSLIELQKKSARTGEKSCEEHEHKEFAKLHKKAFENYLRYDFAGISSNPEYSKFYPKNSIRSLFTESQIKYLRTDSDVDGGFLNVSEYVREIIKPETEISPIRNYAKTRQASGIVLQMPSRTGLIDATWAGEGEQDILSNSKYGREDLQLHRMAVTVPMTREQLQDSAFDMIAEINSDVAEKKAQKEGLAFMQGEGVNQPEGLMKNVGIASINSEDAATIGTNDLISLFTGVKQGYKGQYCFNRSTLGRLLKLQYEGGIASYIWNAGDFKGNIPSTILGMEYFIAQDMENVATDAYPVLFGDFSRGYVIADRTSMTVIRDEVTRKRENIIELAFHLRVGGMVVLAEAFKKLKIT